MRLHRWLIAGLGAMLLTACEPAPSPAADPDPPRPRPLLAQERTELREALLVSFTQRRRSLLDQTRQFRAATETLLAQTTPEHLQQARAHWQALYALTLDNWVLLAARAQTRRELQVQLERLDGWPMLVGYVDSVPGWPVSGIIHDISIEPDRGTLRAQQQVTDDLEISLGFQVLHLLLNGFPDGVRTLADLTASDEQLPSQQLPVEQLPENRRRTYLDSASRQLQRDLTELCSPWEPASHDLLEWRLVKALEDSASRLARLEALTDPDDPFGYLPATSRVLMQEHLGSAVQAWLSEDSAPGQALWRPLRRLAPVWVEEVLTVEDGDWSALARKLAAAPTRP